MLPEIWPFTTLTQELPDPVTLAVASLITLLTAGVLEEVFYRAWLQTRLEVLLGTWPAILISSLLFAAIHVTHINPDAVGVDRTRLVEDSGASRGNGPGPQNLTGSPSATWCPSPPSRNFVARDHRE